jgi:prophage regulatory protein
MGCCLMVGKNQNLYLSDSSLSQRYGVARQTVWSWVKKKEFPEPVKLSKGCSRWYLPDVEKWEAERHAS